MTGRVDKAALLADRLPRAEVPIDGLGTVVVRGLSRLEVLELYRRDRSADPPGAFERALIATAMVEPELTEDDVAVWQTSARANELAAVVTKIDELAAIGKPAAKAAYKEFDASPAAEFRARPSDGPVDDGGAAPAGDE